MINSDIFSRFQEAREQLSRQKAVEAQSAFESILHSLRDEPDNPDKKEFSINVVNCMIDAYLMNCDYAKAGEFIKKSMDSYGRLPSLLFQSGRIFYFNKQFDNALNDFKTAIQVLPAETRNTSLCLDIYLNIAETLTLMRQYEEAEKYCQEALSIEPGSVKLYLQRVKILLAKGNNLEALKELEWLKTMPGRLENTDFIRVAALAEAEAYIRLNNTEAAWEAYDKLAGHQSIDASDVRQRIRAAGRQYIEDRMLAEMHDEALKTCIGFLMKDGSYPAWHILAGRSCIVLKKFVEAKEYFDKARILADSVPDDELRQFKEPALEGIIDTVFLTEKNVSMLEKFAQKMLSDKQQSTVHCVIRIIGHFRNNGYFKQADRFCLELLEAVGADAALTERYGHEKALVDIYYLGINTAFDAQDYQKAVSYASKLVLLLPPEEIDGQILCAEAYIRQGNSEAASNILAKAVRIPKTAAVCEFQTTVQLCHAA